jgi:DNA-binding CsgD family transcriptional regulator
VAIQDHVIGRERELTVIAGFLEEVRSQTVSLLIEGVAGIGKTTLWQTGVDRARELGLQALVTRGDHSEAKLSFTALGDLLLPVVDEALPGLPEPQRAALEVALLRVGWRGPPPDPRAVSLATLGVLRTAAASSPLLLAVDDLQWLDPASIRVLGFCMRRLREDTIGLLASSRVGEPGARRAVTLDGTLPRDRTSHLAVGPMPADEIGRMIRGRLQEHLPETDLPRSTVQRIHEMADGNPFFSLEIARELVRRGAPAPGEALAVPDDLADLPRRRVANLPKATRDVLLVAASTSRPTPELVRSVSGLGERAGPALAKAEVAGIVHVTGDAIRFTHPLLASTVYASATSDERWKVHGRLAKHVDDPEERARHLALSSSGPDATIASALDEAADAAVARGAPDSAAELAELARSLTPAADLDASRRRVVLAAEHHFQAGDVMRSNELFDEAISSSEPGIGRAGILFRLAAHSWMDMRRVQGLCEQALEEAEDDTSLRAMIHEHLAWVGIYRGDLADASAHARAAMDHAGPVDDPASRAEVLATFGMVEFLKGRPAQALMSEAEGLQDLATRQAHGTPSTIYTAARTNHALQLLWAGEIWAARQTIQRELNDYEHQGRYLVRDELLCYLAEVECRAGNWDVAAQHAQEAYEIDVESGRLSGQGHMLFPRALVGAHRGDVDAARADASEGLERCLRNDDLLDASCHRAVLGFLELSLSNAPAAKGHLEPAVAFLRTMDANEPGIIPCVPDAIEVSISLGELEPAAQMLQDHEAKGRAMDRPWALATAGRCRGLLLATRGDLDAALDAIEASLEQHERALQPFELGRTLLVKGEIQRRAKQKRVATASITQALEIFEELGARLWAERARGEMERVGGGVGATAGELTPTERRVAQLVVEGGTNREIADALFISVKTVEANISRIFGKLGVRSRTELVRSMVAERPDPEGRA